MRCDCGHEFEPVVEYRHMLVCGDCTDAAAVARLMGGERAALTVTSPPYPSAEMWNTGADELIALGFASLRMVYDATDDGGVLCWNTADVPRGNDGMAPNTARDTMRAYEIGWRKRGDIVWGKGISVFPIPSFTRRPVVPNYTHEAVIVFFKGDWKPRDKTGQLAPEQMAWLRESIWILGVESATASGHQAPYPVQLPERCVTLWSLDGDIVFDPFLGSGTTVAACEKLGRRGRGIELLPKYCAVALERIAGMGVDCHLVEAGPA